MPFDVRFDPSWEPITLWETADWTNGLAFRKLHFTAEGDPVIKIAELKGGISGQTKFTEQEFDPKYRIEPGDMLFSWSGNPDTSIDAFIWNGPPGWVNQHVFKVEPAAGGDFRFHYFLLKYLKPTFARIATNKQTTGLGHVTQRDMKAMKVRLPPLDEQRRIAAVLGALDDRIEVNRRMNRTLEAMAQALFRSRFVDFDGRDDLVESETGPIPSGWRWGKPADLIKFDPRMKLKKGTVARYLGMSEVPTEGFAIGELEERPYKGGSKFVLGDTLLARITPSLENGKTALVDFLEPGEVAFGSTEFIVMRGREGTPREYVYCLARSPEFRDFAIQHMTGSSGRQRVSRDDFDHYDLPIPPRDELAAFDKAARPMFERISINHEHSRTLAALRDALLPRLVSGELRVPEAESAVEAAL